MGQQSDYDRVPNNFYPTPLKTVFKLKPFLPNCFTYDEPCAGEGALIRNLLYVGGACSFAGDILPLSPGIIRRNVLDTKVCHGSMFITNPPWDWEILKLMIPLLARLAPTWLLLPSTFKQNVQSARFKDITVMIVPAGRPKWFPSGSSGPRHDCDWILFDVNFTGATVFTWRTP